MRPGAEPRAKPSSIAWTASSSVSPRAVHSSGAMRTSAYTTPSAARSCAHSEATRMIASRSCMTPTVCSNVSRYSSSDFWSAPRRNQVARSSTSVVGSAS